MYRTVLALSLLASCVAAPARSLELGLPIDCEVGSSCAIQNYVDVEESSDARDYTCGSLTYDGHNGTDFRVPNMAAQRAGVRVLAAAEGVVLRTRDGMEDVGLTVSNASTAGRECGNGVAISHNDGWRTQYCHLAKGSVQVRTGQRVSSGQSIALVGLSGRTEFPHLHFTVRHDDRVVDPFSFGRAGGSCGNGVSIWSASVEKSLAYRTRWILNSGFASGPVTTEAIESGAFGAPPKGANSPALVGYVRVIGLRAGDLQRLLVEGPDGHVIGDHTDKPLGRNKAQTVLFVGARRPPLGWPLGTYRATYHVTRDGEMILEHTFSLSL